MPGETRLATEDTSMTHGALAGQPGLNFFAPDSFAHLPLPYFPQGIAAGFPSPADDHLQKKLDLHEHLIKHPAATFYAHVQGDSMRDANLNDGDLLIIDRAETPRHKSIVVAVLNGEFVVKRLHKRSGELKLLSENKAYPAIEITEGMDFEIWGVVSHIIHKAL
jgi:DNA polymerase V